MYYSEFDELDMDSVPPPRFVTSSPVPILSDSRWSRQIVPELETTDDNDNMMGSQESSVFYIAENKVPDEQLGTPTTDVLGDEGGLDGEETSVDLVPLMESCIIDMDQANDEDMQFAMDQEGMPDIEATGSNVTQTNVEVHIVNPVTPGPHISPRVFGETLRQMADLLERPVPPNRAAQPFPNTPMLSWLTVSISKPPCQNQPPAPPP